MRVMLRGGISFYFALILALFIPNVYTAILAVLCAAGTAVFAFIPKLRRFSVFTFFFGAALGVFLIFTSLYVKPYSALVGETRFVSGTVLSFSDRPDNYGSEILFSPDSLRGNIRVYFSGDDKYKKGDRVILPVKFFRRDSLSDMGSGIFGYALCDANGALLPGSTPESRFNTMSRRLSENIKEYLPGREGDLLVGITAGDKSALSKSDRELLSAAGFSHLINISGLHMSLIAAFIFSFFSLFLSSKRKLAAAWTSVFLIFYMALTGFGVSALRSGIMLLIYYLGYLLNRRNDPLNALGFAATVILLFNPFAVSDPSFQLSLLSTLGIVFMSGKISRLHYSGKIGDGVFKILSFLTPSFAAVIFSAPASAVFFGEVNILSAFSNLFLSVLVTPLVISGMVLGVVSFFGSSFLSYTSAFIAGLFGKGVFFISEFFSGGEYFRISSGSLFSKTVWVLLPLSAILFFTVKFSRKKALCVILSEIILCLSVFSGEYFYNRNTLYYVINTSSGYALCINSKDGFIITGDIKGETAYRISDIMSGKNIAAVCPQDADEETVLSAAYLCDTLSCPSLSAFSTLSGNKLSGRYGTPVIYSLDSVTRSGAVTEIALRKGSIKIADDGVHRLVYYNEDRVISALVKREDKWYNLKGDTEDGKTVRVSLFFGETKEVEKRWGL